MLHVCLAVRENRMPGGVARVKKVRLSSADQTVDVETVVSEAEKVDTEQLMLCQILDARPDIMPLREGKLH